MKTAIAVVLELCAALCFALGSLIQQGAARQAHGRALRLGLLVALARDWRWLGGLALTVFSFHAGPLSLSLPVVDTVEPTAAVVLAAAVFHESLARSPWQLALQLAGAATAVTGIALLSHSCVVVAEDRREVALAAPAAESAPP